MFRFFKSSFLKNWSNVYRFSLFKIIILSHISIKPIQDGEQKAPPPLLTSFSPVTSTNVRISPKTFQLLVLTFLPHWCKISRLYLVPVPDYWIWTKTTRKKKWFFWSNPYKIEGTITSLIEVLELPNFGHMTTFII